MAVINEPATIGIGFVVLLMEVILFTGNQSAELLWSSAHEEQMENIRKPCVDQKNRVELSDIEI